MGRKNPGRGKDPLGVPRGFFPPTGPPGFAYWEHPGEGAHAGIHMFGTYWGAAGFTYWGHPGVGAPGAIYILSAAGGRSARRDLHIGGRRDLHIGGTRG